MSSLSSSERDHALDATRAFALILGVVFHGVWSFVPYDFGAPVVDRSADQFWGWFFFTAHTFRMQLFFLIAGYFARLVVHRRGVSSFLTNRFQRIGIPLLVGWLILFPLVMAAWFWGANLTGRNLTPLPIPTLFELLYANGLIFIGRSEGGFFHLVHLWFLYYLLLFYCIFLMLRVVASNDRAKQVLDGWVTTTIDSVWSPTFLALITGGMLMGMNGWFGVDTPSETLIPSVPVLLLYGTFFSLGWLLQRQPILLRVRNHRWRWQIPMAILISIPLYVAFLRLMDVGAASRIGVHYPRLVATQVRDWPGFLAILQAASQSAEETDLRQLWDAISPETTQLAIMKLTSESTIDERSGTCSVLTKVITTGGQFTKAGFLSNNSPSTMPVEVVLNNRHRLESIFGSTITHDPRGTWYFPMKYMFSVSYALVMWLFVFGTLGVFQDLGAKKSNVWRYWADSSYWVYLVHLPVVPVIQVWMRDWPLPSVVKVSIQLAFAFVVLFGSYHFLVRPTVIGKLLNGRRHSIFAKD